MSTNLKVSGNGIGFGSLLFIVFLVLKLCGVISWSWWWVTAPLWIPFALFGIIFGIVGIVWLIIFVMSLKK